MVTGGDGVPDFILEDIGISLRIPPPELRFWARHHTAQCLTYRRPPFTSTVDQPGLRLAGSRGAVPFSHQRSDTRAVFPRQPVRQFPEHDMVDMPECARGEVGELIERCPTCQLTVQAVDHVHHGNIMITGKRLDQSMDEGLGFLLGYRRDYGHTPVRSPLTDDPVS